MLVKRNLFHDTIIVVNLVVVVVMALGGDYLFLLYHGLGAFAVWSLYIRVKRG